MDGKYWVIGGQYADTSFDSMLDGTGRIAGPFANHSAAMTEWRRLADETRSDCLTRFSIAVEPRR
ncbi:MAG: hypothetical protein QF893_15940 [Alphaproteobacteria bacterium]|jgi:hypothetical protein|nr:hypothetical protein [Alphaproteobacteria bacterium]